MTKRVLLAIIFFLIISISALLYWYRPWTIITLYPKLNQQLSWQNEKIPLSYHVSSQGFWLYTGVVSSIKSINTDTIEFLLASDLNDLLFPNKTSKIRIKLGKTAFTRQTGSYQEAHDWDFPVTSSEVKQMILYKHISLQFVGEFIPQSDNISHIDAEIIPLQIIVYEF